MAEYIISTTNMPDHILEVVAPWCNARVVRCRDCKHSRKDGTLCMSFASWELVSVGDEYIEVPANVEPDGFCKWGEPITANGGINEAVI